MKTTIVLRKLEKHEVIQGGDLHSMDDGKTLATIKNQDSIGQRPEHFHKDRSFWRINDIGGAKVV